MSWSVWRKNSATVATILSDPSRRGPLALVGAGDDRPEATEGQSLRPGFLPRTQGDGNGPHPRRPLLQGAAGRQNRLRLQALEARKGSAEERHGREVRLLRGPDRCGRFRGRRAFSAEVEILVARVLLRQLPL